MSISEMYHCNTFILTMGKRNNIAQKQIAFFLPGLGITHNKTQHFSHSNKATNHHQSQASKKAIKLIKQATPRNATNKHKAITLGKAFFLRFSVFKYGRSSNQPMV
jgi:hypothetical protein